MMLFVELLLVLQLVFWVPSESKNPFALIEAEDYDSTDGARICKDSQVLDTPYVGYLAPGDNLLYKYLNFSNGAMGVKMHLSSNFNNKGYQVMLRLDSMSSPTIASYNIESTGAWDRWITVVLVIPPNRQPKDVHDLFITFGPLIMRKDVVNIDWFQFLKVSDYCPAEKAVPITCPVVTTVEPTTVEPLTCPPPPVVTCLTAPPTEEEHVFEPTIITDDTTVHESVEDEDRSAEEVEMEHLKSWAIHSSTPPIFLITTLISIFIINKK